MDRCGGCLYIPTGSSIEHMGTKMSDPVELLHPAEASTLRCPDRITSYHGWSLVTSGTVPFTPIRWLTHPPKDQPPIPQGCREHLIQPPGVTFVLAGYADPAVSNQNGAATPRYDKRSTGVFVWPKCFRWRCWRAWRAGRARRKPR